LYTLISLSVLSKLHLENNKLQLQGAFKSNFWSHWSITHSHPHGHCLRCREAVDLGRPKFITCCLDYCNSLLSGVTDRCLQSL